MAHERPNVGGNRHRCTRPRRGGRGVDVEKLPFFDIDFLFIALRAKSVGESILLEFTCNATIDNAKCGHVYEGELDLTRCRIVKDSTIESNVNLGGSMFVKMKYPTYSIMKVIEVGEDVFDRKIKIIASCIEMIQKGDEIYTLKDISKKELVEFIENLSEVQYSKLEKFIDNFPYFVVDIETECPKCKTMHSKEYRDFSSFFQ
jgi:hypothetical protein